MEEINSWFNALGYDALTMIFGPCPYGRDANDFIDDCDEWWSYLKDSYKEEIYNHFYNLV